MKLPCAKVIGFVMIIHTPVIIFNPYKVIVVKKKLLDVGLYRFKIEATSTILSIWN